jgi:hypothetical protein
MPQSLNRHCHFCNDFINLRTGTLAPKQRKDIKVTYECDSAKVLISVLSVKLEEGNNAQTYSVKL